VNDDKKKKEHLHHNSSIKLTKFLAMVGQLQPALKLITQQFNNKTTRV
jgi:hypothetical protein